jgi:hypothetical protein
MKRPLARLSLVLALSVFLVVEAVPRPVEGSPPSAACPGSTTSVVATSTTVGVVQLPGDLSTGTPIAPGSSAVTTTTATTAPPQPVYDMTPESVSINEAEEFVSNTKVKVSIVGPGMWKGTMGAATRAELSNDGGFKSSSFFDLVNSRGVIDWTLQASRDGTFTKIVYVRFWNCYGAPAFGSSTLTDDIILDTTKPTIVGVSAVEDSGRSGVAISAVRSSAAPRAAARVTIRGSDSISGVGAIEFRASPRGSTTEVVVGGGGGSVSARARLIAKSIKINLAAKRFQVRLIDRAGNASGWRTVNVLD